MFRKQNIRKKTLKNLVLSLTLFQLALLFLFFLVTSYDEINVNKNFLIRMSHMIENQIKLLPDSALNQSGIHQYLSPKQSQRPDWINVFAFEVFKGDERIYSSSVEADQKIFKHFSVLPNHSIFQLKTSSLEEIHQFEKNGINYTIVSNVLYDRAFSQEFKFLFSLIFIIPLSAFFIYKRGRKLIDYSYEVINSFIEDTKKIRDKDLTGRIQNVPQDSEFRELAETINDLISRLESLFRAQEHFIADASHQLKTPISIIRNEVQMLLTQEQNEETKELVSSVDKEVRTMGRLIDRLLAMTRAEARWGQLELMKIRLDELVGEVLFRINKIAIQKNIKMRSTFVLPEEAGSDYFEYFCEPELIATMLEVLLENAIKYTPEGMDIKVILSRSEKDLVLSIEDKGPGIKEEDREKIFDKFYRSGMVEDITKGYGIGLALAKRICELHHSSISVSNSLEGGCIFKVRLRS
ncbi:MAG: hypothetical protein K2P81_05690 [Bacteriovoracaceae bacterium]|nr:hypothetical protein [Bacteriovoracaceae bacterium]